MNLSFRRRFSLSWSLVLLGPLVLLLWAPSAPTARAATGPRGVPPAAAGATSPATPFAPSLSGQIVEFRLSGFEPDFDPIVRVIISARLHDGRPANRALPDAMLILSLYLENFQPDTTPVLPDLLHPNQTANNLGGFMQGKAILVNQGGRIAYNGDVLAEVFLDNSVHIIIDVQPGSAPSSAAVLRLQGSFTLYREHRSLIVRGALRAVRHLSSSEAALLRVPRGRLPSWQSIVSSVAVRVPKMMGTGSAGAGPTPTAAPPSSIAPGYLSGAGTRHAAPARPARSGPMPAGTPPSSAARAWILFVAAAVVFAIAVVAAFTLLWRPHRRRMSAAWSDHNAPGGSNRG